VVRRRLSRLSERLNVRAVDLDMAIAINRDQESSEPAEEVLLDKGRCDEKDDGDRRTLEEVGLRGPGEDTVSGCWSLKVGVALRLRSLGRCTLEGNERKR
jgi:hypothetical protein